MEEVRDLQQLNTLQENFLEMQGLRKLPIGVFVLFACGLELAGLVGWWRGFEFWAPFVGITIFAASVWCFWTIGDYYERNLGLVLESWPTRWREALVWSCVMTSMIATLVGVELASLPNLLAGLAIMWMVGSYFRTGKLWPHASVLIVLSSTMFQLQVIESSSPFWGVHLALVAMLGVVLVATGVYLHCQLVKMLGPAPEDE